MASYASAQDDLPRDAQGNVIPGFDENDEHTRTELQQNAGIESILLVRKPIVDVSEALNMTLAGVIAHQSALKDGEWMKVPQYDL